MFFAMDELGVLCVFAVRNRCGDQRRSSEDTMPPAPVECDGICVNLRHLLAICDGAMELIHKAAEPQPKLDSACKNPAQKYAHKLHV
jgi:hypothetical protein